MWVHERTATVAKCDALKHILYIYVSLLLLQSVKSICLQYFQMALFRASIGFVPRWNCIPQSWRRQPVLEDSSKLLGEIDSAALRARGGHSLPRSPQFGVRMCVCVWVGEQKAQTFWRLQTFFFALSDNTHCSILWALKRMLLRLHNPALCVRVVVQSPSMLAYDSKISPRRRDVSKSLYFTAIFSSCEVHTCVENI